MIKRPANRRIGRKGLVLVAAALLGCAAPVWAENWPQFRGPHSQGVSFETGLPVKWSATQNVKWKTPLPGPGHSSPIIWGNRIFLTAFRPGGGKGQLLVLSLDKATGRILWEREVPAERIEQTHSTNAPASPTPVTDGRYVYVYFGSRGLVAFDFAGNKVWEKPLGPFPNEWGTASSPIIYKDLAIVQCDTQGESFVLAVNLKNGETVWKTVRKELPSWGTPTVVVPSSGSPELVTNASNFVRAYDVATGAEKWRLGGSSKITAPTPIFSRGLIVVASGRAPERPIFVIRPGGSGDITPASGAESGSHVVWKKTGRGSYMPTPIAYGDSLYVLSNAGLFDAYELETGKEVYRQRVEHGGSGFSASPVAGDGRIYLSSEDGDVFVLRAGPTFEILSKNPMGEPLMATPAIAGGTIYIRSERHLFAIGAPNR